MKSTTRLLSRDPFARQELHKRMIVVTLVGQSCRWCGAHDGMAQMHHGQRLYQFEIHHDDKHKPDVIPGLFCSVGCMRNYHQH